MRALALLVAVAAACSGDGLPVLGDGGAADQVASPTCDAIRASVQALLDGNQACTKDSDCVAMATPCGLPGVCGAWLAVGARAQLDGLDAQWTAMGCGAGQACPNCAPRLVAACNAGTCGPRSGPGPVGASCQAPFDCASLGSSMAQCLAPPMFPDGECVLPCTDGNGCPGAGMLCEPVAPTANATFCFAQCMQDADCRTSDGYRCCPVWGPRAGSGSVCYPGPCPTGM